MKTLRVTLRLPLNKISMHPSTYQIWWHLRRMKRTRKSHKNEDKNLKYKYKVNTNILIGKFKDSMVLMLLEDNSEKRNSMFHRIMQEISKNMVPIRPNRSKPRNMGRKAPKHPLNQKRCL